MFDANGRLALQSSLQVAQAMCLLTIYEGIAQDETLPDPSQRPPWATYRGENPLPHLRRFFGF